MFLYFLCFFLNLQIAFWTCLLLCLAIFWLPCLSFHIPHSALICMGACVSLGVPDNLSEVLLKLMRGDSIRLQTPLINLSRSSCMVHANELFKCVTGAVPSERQKRVCLNFFKDWVLNWTKKKKTVRKNPVSSSFGTGNGQFPTRVPHTFLTSEDLKCVWRADVIYTFSGICTTFIQQSNTTGTIFRKS